MSKSRAPAPYRGPVARWWRGHCGIAAATGLNAIVVTFVFSVYLTSSVGAGLPGDTSPGQLARAGAVRRRGGGRGAGPCHRGLGRRAASPPSRAGRAHRGGGAADRGDEPDPRRRPLPLAGLRAARLHRGLQRSGQRPVQRDAAAACRPRRPSGRVSGFGLGGRLFRQLSCCCWWSTSASSPATARHRGLLDDPDGRRPERPRGDAADRRVVRAVRAAGADRGARRRHRAGPARPRSACSAAYRKLWADVVERMAA